MPVFSAKLELDGNVYDLKADLDITGRWRLSSGLGGLFHLTSNVLEVDVREGAAKEAVSLLSRREKLQGLMEAARQLSCSLGVRVVLRVYGLRVASIECSEEEEG